MVFEESVEEEAHHRGALDEDQLQPFDIGNAAVVVPSDRSQ